ncbi:MAG: hypothetical protein ACYC8T_39465 [Myxococcaceae bacterium]
MKSLARLRVTVLIAAGLVFALWGAASCGTSPSARGTAMYVTVSFPTELSVRQLRFRATASGGADVFEPAVRPTTAPAKNLSSPQTERILLLDSLDGVSVRVEVQGLGPAGELLAEGSAAATVARGTETYVNVGLKKAGAACVNCDPLKTDRCSGDLCQCGSGAPCEPGLRCGDGGVCVCDVFSACQGCCGSGACILSSGPAACGRAGERCDQCTGCNQGVCTAALPCGPGTCASGSRCFNAAWPTCAGTGRCIACDPRRSNQCLSDGGCGCGGGPACAEPLYCRADAGACTANP